MVTEHAKFADAVADALQDAPLMPRDAAAVRLVERYAELLDDGEPELIADIGPKLLRALESLGMTLAGRGVRKGDTPSGKPVDPAEDEIARQRAVRAARADRAKAVDSSAP